MPARDPDDQAAAREFEQMLRYYVYSGRSPQSKLDWFLQLPKRVRRSRALIGEALGPFEEEQERKREARERHLAEELERTIRLQALRTQPRDLASLHIEGTRPWTGLGRRKKRCRVFELTGRAYAVRQRCSPPPASTVPVPTIPETTRVSCSAQTEADPVPTRPTTPEGLRVAVRAAGYLPLVANGPASYGLNTPSDPTPPPSPPTRVVTRVVRRPPSPVEPPLPYPVTPGETVIDGVEVDWRLAYIVALGRHKGCPWARPITLRQAAQDILDTEEMQPGAISCLLDLFFPHGLDDWSLARPKLLYLLDVCRGWRVQRHAYYPLPASLQQIFLKLCAQTESIVLMPGRPTTTG
ncbi:hypothetical protein BDV93DRAFT_511052 [Ceratobasidium sp. AG-I]|nr:hypothetical protein BDV93DRAFT_511052 [Ceratobasidium sp. AG-I]